MLARVVIVLACLSGAARADEASNVKVANYSNSTEIARLIKQLGHDDFMEREAATKRLVGIGKRAFDALREARSSDDPEVRWRAAAIIAARGLYGSLADGTTPGQRWAGNGLRMEFRWCPPGEFKMGERPNQVDVTLSRGFWLGKCEVTQDEYRQVMNDNPSSFPRTGGMHATPEGRVAALAAGIDVDQLPVDNVSWGSAVEFCRRFTEHERKAGRLPPGWEYRLPTEAQWEYACRAGSQTAYSFGDDESRLGDFAWYSPLLPFGARRTHESRTHEVGQKLPNAWGLRDMHGNVWEWCCDSWRDTVAGGTDPAVANEEASDRVLRGSSWGYPAEDCRSGLRTRSVPAGANYYPGFRVAAVQSRGEMEEK
jgi:formylglycine-generating enzyme required for sulfatase activity